MPRNRMIKPDFWNDEKLGKESESIQLTYVGTWNFSDDYGVVRANPVWLKNQLFPYKESLRLEAFSKWLDALERMEMLIKFTVRGEQYYFIRTFRLHQSVEKPSKTRNCTEEELLQELANKGFVKQQDNSWKKVVEQSGNSRGILPAEDKLSISGSEVNRAKALVAATAATGPTKEEYKKLVDEYTGQDLKTVVTVMKDFLAKRPTFIQPYIDYWNIAVESTSVPKVKSPSDSRQKKLKTRLEESEFDFVQVVKKFSSSRRLKTESTWFSFDWVFENDKNYLKVLEGNYDS